MTDQKATDSPTSVSMAIKEPTRIMVPSRAQMSDEQRAAADQAHADATKDLPDEPTPLVANEPTRIVTIPNVLRPDDEPQSEPQASQTDAEAASPAHEG